MRIVTKNGILVDKSKRYHEHSQITENLLKEAIINESEPIEKAFELREGLRHSLIPQNYRCFTLRTMSATFRRGVFQETWQETLFE